MSRPNQQNVSIPARANRSPFQSLGFFGGASLALLAAGCTVGPNYSGAPKTAIPYHFKGSADSSWKMAEPRDAESRAGWWTVFHDSTLNRLEEAAAANNLDIQLAIDRIREARAEVRVAAADFYPGVTLAPSAVRMRTSNTEPFQRGELLGPAPFGGAAQRNGPLVIETQPLSRTYNLFRVPADLNWELDLFGRVRRNKEAASATAQAQSADFQNTQLSVAANLAINYYNLRGLDSEIDVLENTVKTRKEALQIAEERFSAGLTSELDVARARSDLASNESDLLSITRSRGEVENAIATLVGRPASGFHVAKNALHSAPPGIPAGLPSRLLERRPDVASAERQLAAANARVGVANAAFFPQIRLTGYTGFESADLGLLFNWQSRIWQLGPSVSLPLLDGGRNRANLNASQARFSEQVDVYRRQVLVAFQDVENALLDLRTLAGQDEAQSRAVSAATRALQLSQEQYGRGAVNFLEVLDAQRTLLADQRIAATVLAQRLQATVQLIKALGGRWDE